MTKDFLSQSSYLLAAPILGIGSYGFRRKTFRFPNFAQKAVPPPSKAGKVGLAGTPCDECRVERDMKHTRSNFIINNTLSLFLSLMLSLILKLSVVSTAVAILITIMLLIHSMARQGRCVAKITS